MAISQEEKDRVAGIIKTKEQLYTKRQGTWSQHWDELAEFFIPRKDRIYGWPTRGEEKMNRLFNEKSVHAVELLASALNSMLTSPTSRWFNLSTGDIDLDENTEIQLWLDDVGEIMMDALNQSNFGTQIHETYLDLVSIGTTALLMESHPDDLISFTSKSIYQVLIDEDDYKRIDTVIWYSEEDNYSYKQLINKYGEDNVHRSDDLKRMGEADPYERRFRKIHCLKPNKSYDKDKPLVETNRPYIMTTVLESPYIVLEEKGYYEMPFAIPRWSVLNEEMYGRSPAMKALPTVRMLNAVSKTTIEGMQKVMDPVLMLPDNGFIGPFQTHPGAKNYKRTGAENAEPLQTGARPDIGVDWEERLEAKIDKAFFIDQLQLREADRMTATEVQQRNDDRLVLLSPILGRLSKELLEPIIIRVFGILSRENKFPAAPGALKGKDVTVKFISKIARAQKSSESDTLNRVINAMIPVVESQPQVLQMLDGEEIIRSIGRDFGMPAKFLKSRERMDAEKAAAQEQILEQEAMQDESMQAETNLKQAQAQQVSRQ